jgi:hypothetical protein
MRGFRSLLSERNSLKSPKQIWTKLIYWRDSGPPMSDQAIRSEQPYKE